MRYQLLRTIVICTNTTMGLTDNNLYFVRYKLQFPKDSSWGAPNAQGEWNGMIRELMDGVSAL